MTTEAAPLATRRLSYDDVGSTHPEVAEWRPPSGFRSYEKTVLLGGADVSWEDVSSRLLSWVVKTRSGFAVEPAVATGGVAVGERYWLLARLGPAVVREPVQVVSVVADPDRRGFAYGTLTGHPVSGEEAFIVHRGADGAVRLTLRSLTRPGTGWWRSAFPAVLIAQRWYRRRYQRALVG